jgi:hypothetical protein
MRFFAFPALAAFLSVSAFAAQSEWQRDATTLAWRTDGKVVWQFSFDAKKGKPFFNPLSVTGGPTLTNFRPEDHPWHYGLWFSWKYINHVNYWEEDRQSGKAEGATRWSAPAIETRPDGGATIRLDVSYVHPSGRVDMTETRELRISAPGADGSYAIDWRADFTAGEEGALLDRTPLLGEPEGKVNGGYAGIGIRMANEPLAISFVSPAGPITKFESDRARPASPAIACNFSDGANDVGGIAILSDPTNAGENAPWYLINSAQMRFACPAILAPKPLMVAKGEHLTLRYRFALRRAAWTPDALRTAMEDWKQAAR